jgi:serine/threonine protein kinase
MAPAPQSSPLARIRLDHKGRYRVGRKLGQGAQGVVHSIELKETNEDTRWCCKLAPHPRVTKNRRSEAEINARHLCHERQLYQASLPMLQGTIIPKVPSGFKNLRAYGEDAEAGWDFLVIERMEQELWEALPSLPNNKNSIALGPLAQRMLYIFQQVHEQGYLVVDVKPENFMVAPPASPAGESYSSIVDRLRLVDLGLLKSYRSCGGGNGHALNEARVSLSGTPLYASLRTHQLETPSRRDDIESLLYLLGEIVICVNARVTGKTALYRHKNSFFPWSQATSDESLGQLKEAHVSDPHSDYYARMPPAAAMVLKQCWDDVRNYSYRKEPEYDALCQQLASLAVPVVVVPVVRRSPRKRPAAAAAGRADTMEAEVEPSAANEGVVPNVVYVEEYSDDNDGMEVDEVWQEEENRVPLFAKEETPPVVKANRMYYAAVLEATSGPHKGSKWVIQEGEDAKWCIGSKPSSNKTGFKSLLLDKDPRVDANHAHLKLVLNRRMLQITVYDKSSSSGTFVGRTHVTGYFAAFSGNVIRVGDTELTVRSTLTPDGKVA